MLEREKENLEATMKAAAIRNTNNMRFKPFVPRGAIPSANDGLNSANDFVFNPRKFYCKKH